MTKQVDLERFANVLKHLHSRLRPEDVWRTYDNWENIYKENRLKQLTLEECVEIAKVIGVRSERLAGARNEIIYFLRNNQKFYNDNVNVMCERMRVALQKANEEGNVRSPALNWLPEYGGIIQDRRAALTAERIWRSGHQIPYSIQPLESAPQISMAAGAPVSGERESIENSMDTDQES